MMTLMVLIVFTYWLLNNKVLVFTNKHPDPYGSVLCAINSLIKLNNQN